MSTTATKYIPILFSSPMARALLDGRKTQTRRLVSHNARGADEVEYVTDALIWPGRGDEKYTGWVAKVHKLGNLRLDLKCPYGVPGDMLWVKETHALRSDVDPMTDVAKAKHYCRYRADGGELADEWHHYPRWRPSIHMPRWACRLYLEVVSVRVQRLWDINEDDAVAEGCEAIPVTEADVRQTVSDRRTPQHIRDLAKIFGPGQFTAKFVYSNLWDSINGAGSWSSNPFVWVVAFKRTEAPK